MSEPSPVAVRPLGRQDVPRLVALERLLFGPSAWSEHMLREELEAPGRWYVGIDGDEVVRDDALLSAASRCVGYAGLWFDGDVAQVMTIGVAPSAQRRGLGTVLLETLVDRSRVLGATAVLLEVRVDNDAALALYRRSGFSVVRRRKRYYQPEDVDAWTMRLEL
ncbi:MAG: rimI [Actinotalea sp.]|nr:rimI [Actinotalea sp.]